MILSVAIAVIVIIVVEVIIIKAREPMAQSSSEPGRQHWTWGGCPRDW